MSKSDKTEKPTPKKKKESKEKGQVAKSQDLTSWASLLVALYVLPWSIGRIATATASTFNAMRATANAPETEVALGLFAKALRDGFIAVAPLMAVVVFSSVVATVGQVGVMLAPKALKPDFKRISPKQGFQRLFSIRSIWETVKQLLKIGIISAIAWPRMRDLFNGLIGNGRLPLGEALPLAASGTMGLARTVTWTVFILSFADYGYQRFQTQRDLKMSKQEVRDEQRNTEGDAQVKGRIRSLQRALARNRMLASVADANVVVTNPTHISVALAYTPGEHVAPKIVAVGVNNMAMRIRERAAEHDVPIVEAKPLARALWRACEPGDEIPGVLYEAVAHVLAFVRRLDERITRPTPGVPLDLPRDVRLDTELLDAVPKKSKRRR